MPSAKDVILKHIDAVNGHDSDADPWTADAEMTAPGAQVSRSRLRMGAER